MNIQSYPDSTLEKIIHFIVLLSFLYFTKACKFSLHAFVIKQNTNLWFVHFELRQTLVLKLQNLP